MQNFKTFHICATFYHAAKQLKLRTDLQNQLLRAASSICLNLAEGRGRRTRQDQLRHFHIAMGSLRECQAILTIEGYEGSEIWTKLDKAGASLYQLIKLAR